MTHSWMSSMTSTGRFKPLRSCIPLGRRPGRFWISDSNHPTSDFGRGRLCTSRFCNFVCPEILQLELHLRIPPALRSRGSADLLGPGYRVFEPKAPSTQRSDLKIDPVHAFPRKTRSVALNKTASFEGSWQEQHWPLLDADQRTRPSWSTSRKQMKTSHVPARASAGTYKRAFLTLPVNFSTIFFLVRLRGQCLFFILHGGGWPKLFIIHSRSQK